MSSIFKQWLVTGPSPMHLLTLELLAAGVLAGVAALTVRSSKCC
jgi:hypothetical protein